MSRMNQDAGDHADRLLQAVDQGEWDRVKLALHPYVHWTAADGHTIRGRTIVLARLRDALPPSRPTKFELRDEQIYRWTE
jgi:hypothetical protein